MMRVAVDPVVEASTASLPLKHDRSTRRFGPKVVVCIAVLFPLGTSRAAEQLSTLATERPSSKAYADRSDVVDLSRSAEAFRSGDLVGGVSNLRRLLDRPFDSFLPAEGSSEAARVSAEKLLQEQSSGVRQFYESAETASASAALKLALEEESPGSLRRVFQRFPTTEPGFRAVDRLAAAAFDRGDYDTAARVWGTLLADPRHAKRATPATVARLLTALRRTGKDARASELSIRFSGMPLRLRGERATIGDLWAAVDPADASLPTTAEASAAGAGLTAPAFPPLWAEGGGDTLEVLRELWVGSRRAEARPVATPAGAVLTNESVVVRTPAGLEALDSRTGATLWTLNLAAPCAAGTADGDRHDLNRFELGYASGGVYGRITADADRVYVIGRDVDRSAPEVKTASHVPVPIYDHQLSGDQTNRLLAVSIADGPRDREPVWRVGGTTGPGHPLEGHYFFGPPCVTADGLVAVTEHRQCLNLVSLDPVCGEVLWRQPLGYVTRPVSADAERAAAACRATVASGIAVCSTNAGFVVAFDSAAGRLLWNYDYSAVETDGRSGQDGPMDRVCYYGDLAFPCPAVVRRNHVVLMPHDSRLIHCVDLETGSVLWTAPREDGLYVGCVTETAVLVVGRSRCRSLSIAGGSPLWSARAGVPSGTGVATDRTYLLPLEDGRIVAIDLARGHMSGFDVPRSAQTFEPAGAEAAGTAYFDRWRPGNLYTDGQTLLSIGAIGVAKFRVASAPVALAAAAGPLDTARVELAAGHLGQAEQKLKSLVGGADPSVRGEAKSLLAELYYLRMDAESVGDVGGVIAELDRLSMSPAERGRFLLRAAEQELATGDEAALLGRAEELSRLSLPTPLPSPCDPTLLVTSRSWVPALLSRTADRNLDPPAATSLAQCDRTELERRLPFLRGATERAAVSRELARRALEDGELQRAESFLLQSLEVETSPEANRILDDLHCRAGLLVDGESADRAAGVVASVNVTGRLWSSADDGVCRTFGSARRSFATRGRDAFRVVDRGDSRHARLAVVDLAGGVCLGEVTVDSRLRFPLLNRQPAHGHFVPVATVGTIHGLSLFESHRGQPVWTTSLPATDGLLPQVGPYGPSFCTVQTRRELTTLDPISGEVLWQRTELSPERGLHGDQAAGLFGDRETLTMLDADGASYVTYRTGTGEEVGSGRLAIDRQRQRRAYGRKLFFVETGDACSTARLWDPLTNSYELAVEFEGKLLQTSTRDDELVLLFGDGRLLIYDTAAGVAKIDLKLAPAEAEPAHAVWVFSDSVRYYVSLYHPDPGRFDQTKVTSFLYDTPLSAAHVQGRLIAIERNNGQVSWSRGIDQRSILDPVDHPMPFLVAVARMSDRRFGNRKTLLVEAIDVRTGATLGINDALLADQPLQVHREAGRVELAGMNSTVVLDFTSERAGEDLPVLRRSGVTAAAALR